MGCPKIAYNLYSKPAMRCVYAAAGQESYICDREEKIHKGGFMPK